MQMMARWMLTTTRREEVTHPTLTNTTTVEMFPNLRLSLFSPTMRDRVRCELRFEGAPKAEVLSRGEMEETWVIVSADGLRALAFARTNARAGEKPVGALVVFQATDVREATLDERKALQEARRALKTQATQRRAAPQPDREAEKAAAEAAGEHTA